jgi:acetyl esterase/lipase
MNRSSSPTCGRRGWAVTVALAMAPLAACSGTAVINALTPTSGYMVERDIAYGSDPRQRLDLYVPAGAGADAPLLVLFYGGNWQTGEKADYAFVGQAFASRGYVTAIPDYRLYPEVRYPAFVADGAAAVAWLDARRAGNGHRPLFLVGHSAGAYIAAMLALDPRWLAASGAMRCPPVTAAVGLAGPYDFLPLHDATLEAIFGPGPAAPDSQPIQHVGPGPPPMLLATGDDDHTVRPANSRALALRLEAVGAPAELRVYAGVGHVGIVAALAAPLRFLAPALDDADRFLRQAALGAASPCVRVGALAAG